MSSKDDISQLINENGRRLQILKQQQAQHGISVEPKILLEIEDIEIQITNLQRELDNLDKISWINPYRGLSAFDEADAKFFFGRDLATNQLAKAVRQKPLVALVGPSGSGKSSLIFAGLLPRLKRPQPSGKGWLITRLRPGVQPFSALAEALVPLLEPEKSEVDRIHEGHKLEAAFKEGRINLNEVVTRIRQKHPEASRLLLIVDQFEELYTLCSEVELRQQFQETLLAGIEATQAREEVCLTVLLSLRADFMGSALAHRAFADAFQEAIMMLGPMSRDELRQAIEKPAEKQGVSFESGLVSRILDKVGDEAGNLPLLEFALTSLWDRQKEGKMTHAAYMETGQVDGALTRYAEEIYAGLNQSEREIARRVLLQMVQPGEVMGDTRRLASRTELGDKNWEIAQRLADKRLVMTNRAPGGLETAEVVHEALIHGWQQLREWVDADRVFRAWQEQLRASLRQWALSKHDEGALLRGRPLAVAENWLAEREADLSQDEKLFIQESINLRERERAERERQQAEQLAERERQRRQRVRWLSIGLVGATIGLCIMASLAGVATWQGWAARTNAEIAEENQLEAEANLKQAEANEQQAIKNKEEADKNKGLAEEKAALAEENAATAFTRRLTAESLRYVADQYDLTLLLNLEAADRLNQDNTAEIRRSLLTGLASNPLLETYLRGHTANVNTVAYSPDGQILASAGDDYTIILWDTALRQPLGQPLTGHENNINTIIFSSDGKTLASGDEDGKIRLWDIEDREPLIDLLAAHQESVESLAFSPDGNTLVTGSADRTIKLWDITKRIPEQIGQPLTGHQDIVWSLSFDLTGLFMASGGGDGRVILWNLKAEGGPTPLSTLYDHTDSVYSVAFHPRNPFILVSSSRDTTVIIWYWLFGKFRQLSGHNNSVLSVAFSEDGSLLASGGYDNNIILWDTSSYRQLTALQGHKSGVRGLAFRPKSSTFNLASGSYDGTVILWKADGHRLAEQIGENSWAARGVTASPDGKFLASGGDDDSLNLWNVENIHSPRLLHRFENKQAAY